MEPQLQSKEEAKEIPGEDRRVHANPPNSKWDQLSLPGSEALPLGFLLRQDKRKAMKKIKRKQMRKEAAEKERMQEEARLKDPAEQLRIQQEEEAEAKAQEIARREFEERERIWLENHQRTIAEAQRKHQEDIEKNLAEEAARKEEEENWEYVEGPAEIIWQGNEIIVQKKKVKVPKGKTDVKERAEDSIRPTSNPLPPQHATFEAYKKEESLTTSLRLCDGIEQQISNIGTEQDKAHCPFHFKTGACRFGSRCSRAHFYPDKSCTLLMKNMYNGPGLTWEQEEGLEYTEEEVTQHYEEFYDDVHTEFLKFGELVNFKVCKNGSSHLRGNVYVHYHSLDSAVSAYNAINGRFFAGKQVTCEFVGVTRWKVALCGEYMRSCYKNCSHGSECNFLHCFQNPGREYDWADWDNPPPRSWVTNMEMLFGKSISTHNNHRKLKEQDNLHRYGQSERRIQSGGSCRSNSRQYKSHELISWTSDYSGGTSLRQHTGGLHYDKKTKSEVSCRSSFRKYKSYESDSCSIDEIGETPLKEHSSGNKYIVDEGELGSDTDQSCDTYGRKSNRKSRSNSRVGSGNRNRDGKGISEEDRSMDRSKRSKYQSRHILRDDNEKRERIVDDYMYFVVEKQPKSRESRNKFVNELDESRSYDRETMEEDYAKSSCYEKERRKASRTAEDHLESSNIDNEKIKSSRRGHRLVESQCNHKDNREESGKQQYSKSPRGSMNNNRSKRQDIGQSMSPKQHKYSCKFSSRNRDVNKAPKRSSDEDSLDTLDRWQASDDADF